MTDKAEAEDFASWLAREMPAGTVIADPEWWAPRILRAALKAQPAPAEAQGEDSARLEWISVADRLPERGQQVIAFRPTAELTQDTPVRLVRYTESARESWQGVSHGFDCICHPTHWMPLPAVPQPQEQPHGHVLDA